MFRLLLIGFCFGNQVAWLRTFHFRISITNRIQQCMCRKSMRFSYANLSFRHKYKTKHWAVEVIKFSNQNSFYQKHPCTKCRLRTLNISYSGTYREFINLIFAFFLYHFTIFFSFTVPFTFFLSWLILPSYNFTTLQMWTKAVDYKQYLMSKRRYQTKCPCEMVRVALNYIIKSTSLKFIDSLH